MIAIDTSSWVAYFAGDAGPDVDLVDEALGRNAAMLPPVVLTELFSDPHARGLRPWLARIPLLTLQDGYWERAGALRARLLKQGLKARLADTLIAQSCLDAAVPLLTRDADFRHFARLGGLRLIRHSEKLR